MKKLCCVLVLAGLLLPGCARKGEELPIVKVLAMEYSAHSGPYWSDLAKSFNKQNKDLTVEVEAVPWDQGERKTWDAIDEKEPYDLVNVARPWQEKLLNQDKLEPLDAYLNPDFKGRFFQAALDANSINGHLYGLPFNASIRMLYYRSDLLGQLAEGDQPMLGIATWQDLEGVAKKLRQKVAAEIASSQDPSTDPLDELVPFAQSFGGGDGHLLFTCFLYAAGGRVFDQAGRCVLDSPQAKEALDLLVSMRRSGLSNPDADKLQSVAVERLFEDGRAGMLVSGLWFANILHKEAPGIEFEMLPVPAPHAQAGGSLLSTDALVMLRGCQHKKLAWRFVEHVFQVEQRRTLVCEELTLPVLTKVGEEIDKLHQEPAFRRRLYPEMRWDASTFKALMKMTGALPHARPLPLHPRGNVIFAELVPYLQAAYRLELKPEEALRQATEGINSKLLSHTVTPAGG